MGARLVFHYHTLAAHAHLWYWFNFFILTLQVFPTLVSLLAPGARLFTLLYTVPGLTPDCAYYDSVFEYVVPPHSHLVD